MARPDSVRERPGARPDRRNGGSIVTGFVVVFMLVALLFYLAVAWVTSDSEEPEPSAPAAEHEHDH